jgi:hypothetical protein
MNVIDSECLERDASGKPGPGFLHPALAGAFSSEVDTGSHIDLDVSIDRHRCENATKQ